MGVLNVWTGTEWEPVQGLKGNPGDPGAGFTASASHYPTLQDAADDVAAKGGGKLYIDEAPAEPVILDVPDGVYLLGRGSGATVMDVERITSSGSLTDLPTLAGTVARHSRTLTFAAAPAVVPGDVIVLHSTIDGSFNTARPYYRAGEFCRVIGVSGSTVTVSRPLYDTYTGGATLKVYKVNPVRTGISGMTLRCTPGEHAVRINLGMDLTFDDVVLSGTDVSHITLSRCYNIGIRGVTAFDVNPETVPGLNYGIMMLNCQRVRIADCDLETRRHGLTMGGDNSPASVPNRDILVSDGRISGLSSVAGVCGCNMHGNSEDVHFRNVLMPAGFNPSGDDVTVRGCEIESAPWGSFMSAMEMLGTNFTFEGNTFRLTRNFPNVRGGGYMLLDADCVRPRGLMRFLNNTFESGPYGSDGAAHYMLHILVNHENVAGNNVLEIKGNSFRTSQAVGANHYGARVRTANGGTGFDQITVTGNTGNMPVGTQATPVPMRFEGEGFGAPAFVAAKGSRYFRKDGGEGTTLYINETGTSTWRAV